MDEETWVTCSSIRSGLLVSFMLCMALFLSGLSLAAEKGAAPEGKKTEKEPTIITSRTLTTDSKAKTALFEGSVVAKKGEMTLFADKMLVYYMEEKGSTTIKRIDAEGKVKLVKGDRIVTSKFATYFAEPEERVIFTGDPKASDGENVILGTKMTYYMKDDRSIVEHSKAFLVSKEQKNQTAGQDDDHARP